MFPVSILTAGMGVNFTCVSYHGSMDFGIIVDPDLVPNHDSIASGLKDALAQYLALSQPKKRTRKKPAAKTKRKPAAKKTQARRK